MPLRFNKRISLGKFFKVNLGKSGVSFSVGVPGAHFTTGTSGNRVSVGIPGTGLSYTQKLDEKKKSKTKEEPSAPLTTTPSVPSITSPLENEIVSGLNALNNGDADTALQHFNAASTDEAGAAILSAYLLARKGEKAKAISILEPILKKDVNLPTPLMNQHMSDVKLEIAITPNVSANLSVSSLAVALLLAELYQHSDQVAEAISLLEEIDSTVDASPLTLSLCELYASQDLWDELIACAKKTENLDDVTLETLIWYGRAMQEKGLQQAAAEVFTDALRKKKDRNPTLLREALYWRAVAYDRLGKKSQAFGEFQKIYAADPDYRDVALRVIKE